jgi:hypothetical protein
MARKIPISAYELTNAGLLSHQKQSIACLQDHTTKCVLQKIKIKEKATHSRIRERVADFEVLRGYPQPLVSVTILAHEGLASLKSCQACLL